MKELAIISGKGGTGKTTITAAFAALAKNKVMVDCDVDAADLHLILNPEIQYQEVFYGGKIADIRLADCIECKKCIEVCRFDAISSDYVVNPISCEGCSVCVHFCPVDAINFSDHLNGEWYISNTRFGPLVHARLGVAEENSGKLVTVVRNQAKKIAEEKGLDLIIIDGAPGIGCPVISSITGANGVLLVTEPTLSGLHDLKRVVNLAKNHFNIPTFVCVNKFDLNLNITDEIEKYCYENNLHFVGKIAYDATATKAMVAGKSVIEFADGEISQAIKKMWDAILKILLA